MAFKIQVSHFVHPWRTERTPQPRLGLFSHTAVTTYWASAALQTGGERAGQRISGCIKSPNQTPLGLEVQERLTVIESTHPFLEIAPPPL